MYCEFHNDPPQTIISAPGPLEGVRVIYDDEALFALRYARRRALELAPVSDMGMRRLLRQDTAGDPMGRRGLWTGKHLEQISEQLRHLGISVCPNTVRRLLDRFGYALRANRKSLSGTQSPERDRQFRYLNRQRNQFTQKALPVISVDTKKKELVGRFKNAGRVWSQEAVRVNDHDFRSQAKGVAIPRGLYDPQANRGSVLVGTSHDTPEFAVDAIVYWWRGEGCQRYPQASSSGSKFTT